ncbi:MAG TPA: FAD-linked oxidase C-terminal domain-containing protein, partial [Rhodothermales bacterium]|nr:FAD-linked oxidase C-terminal domain-containing protein [Rhodothermales bacterium]
MEAAPDVLHALQADLRGHDLRLDALTRGLYATDGSMYQQMPLGVFFPRHKDEVQACVEACVRLGLPVLPRGAGSSLAGQTVNAAVVIDFARYLGGVLEVNAEERWARVQPGIVLDALSKKLNPHGLMVGPDPASSSRATLGGMVGSNSTGTHSIVYGNTVHHVRRLDTVLADGSTATFGPVANGTWEAKQRAPGLEGRVYAGLAELLRGHSEIIRRDTARHWRRNSGYRLEQLLTGLHADAFAGQPGGGVDGQRNVARLLCGSEGTLAVTTEIELALVEKPHRTALGVAHFTSLDAALRSVPAMLATGPSAIELFDDYAVRAAKASPGFGANMAFVQGTPGAILITEYFGDSDAELRAKVDALEAALNREAQGFYALVRAVDPKEIATIWTVRKEGLGIIMSARGDLKPLPFIEDASVPPEHLADYVAQLLKVLNDTNTPVALYAHASAGCLHIRPFINLKDAADVQKMVRIAEASMELVRGYGGTVSSEHADGRARSWLNPGLLGPALYDLNVQVKRLFDPENRLNPGNVVEAGPMSEHLRIHPGYHTAPVETNYSWADEGGYAMAVEQCNGNAACRKLESGVMCPSFMVTLEEQHTTRGRANALRLALAGQLPGGFTGPEVEAAMDLCVMCKACKTECPSNVDMARMKGEWLARHHEAHGVSFRTRMIARQPMIARHLPKRMRTLANWANRNAALRRRMEKAQGITARRPLPEFARETFAEWFARQKWTGTGPEVVLFADSFNNYNHPEVAQAAALFLDRAGYRLFVSDEKACCGRTLLSKGFLNDAKVQAQDALTRLMPHVEAGRTIVGLEPSCLLTFGDEFRALLPDDPRVARLADASLLF